MGLTYSEAAEPVTEDTRSSPFSGGLISILLVFSLLAVIIFVFLIDLLPPTGRDALIHHLAIPKLWLKAGALMEIPWSSFSYYPMNLELLYLIPLAMEADWAAKLIHHAFGLLSGWLIFQYVRTRLDTNWGLLASLMFLSTPIIIRLSASAYVDLGLVFFITASWMCLIHWAETRKIHFFILSGISLGLGLGFKYNALIAPVLFVPAVMIIRSRAGDRSAQCLIWGLLFTGLILLPFAPWLIKNYLWTGNPIYPLYNRMWGLDSLAPPGLESVGLFNQRRYLYGESLIEIILVPLRIFFQGKDDSPQFFDGVLNPFFLFLPLIALIRPRTRELRPLALMALLWMLLVFFRTSYRTRYILPVLPVLTVLTVYGLHEFTVLLNRYLPRTWSHLFLAMLLAVFLSLNYSWAFHFWQKMDPVPFLTGKETRDEYLTRKLDHYEMMKYINNRLDPDAKILLLFVGNRGYFLDRDYYYHSYYSGESLRPALKKAGSARELWQGLKDKGTTHLLTREALLADYLKNNFDREGLRIWTDFDKEYRKPVHRAKGYTLYKLK